MKRTGVALGLCLAVACGAPSSSPSSPASPAAPSSKAARLRAMCDRYYARERVCVDDYLAALLEVRVEYDMPPGVAAEVERDGKEAVRARMRPEWERDTTVENTDRMCRDMETKVPEEHMDRLIAEGDRCYAEPDCAGFARCTVDSQRSYIKSGAAPH